MLKRFSLFVLVYAFCLSSLAAAVSTNIRQNTVGFLPIAVKRASILGTPTGNFNVRRVADASIAYTGTLPSAITNADTSESMRIADFSAMTETGSFYLEVPGVGQGPNFDVRADIYNDPLWVELAGFSIRRCNQAASFTWKGQTFSHAACHLNDGYQDYIGGGHALKNGQKGWHDAGDFGKYTVNLAFAAGQMLQAWEWHSAVLSAYTLPIPESGNGTPDYLNEMRYGVEWLLSMQAANGTVYHKLTATGFEGFILPESDASQRFFVPYSSSATADFCAVASMAARIYAPYDAAFAAQCQTAATNAWTWLAANPGEVLPNDAGFSTGAYKEAGTDADHRVWAAAEYWQTTGNAAALNDFETRMAADPDKVSTFWDWGEHAYSKRGPKNHGIFTYLLSGRSGRNATRVADLTTDLMAEANGMVATRNAHGYGRPLGTQYHWGSNGTVARQAMLLDCANQITPTQAFVDTAQDAISHIYGRNMYARSFVAGVGYNPPLNPHDRLSASDGIVNPVPGHMAGGPESTAGSWTDTQGDFTTNEIAINWDAALVCALSWFATTPPPPTVTPTPTPMPCFSTTALRRVNAGGPTTTTGGNTWTADQAYAAGGWGYTGGAVSTNSNAIANTTDDVLYNTGRYGMSSYQFTVPNGAYKVEVYVAETYFSTAGARVFSMTLEGQPAFSNLDIYARVGGSAALMLSGSAQVSDGILTLGFSSSADSAEIRAIAIYPATACPTTPTFTPSPNWTATPTPTRSPSFSPSPTATPSPSVSPTATLSPTPCGTLALWRIHAGGGAYTDVSGNAWAADTGFTGGTAASVTYTIAATTDDPLFQTERYGSPLSYALAVPNGNYQIRFLFAETYFSSAGQRLFSVSLEGAPAITNLDIFSAAGGWSRALSLTRTVTVSDGTLNIDATASVDQAKFDGIEVLQLLAACVTPSATGTPTGTPSRSPTPSASASRTATASPSPSASGTSTLTPANSPTASATSSASGTATGSATRSATPTITQTSSSTGTITPGNSPTATPSPSATPTRSTTPTVSPSSSATRTATATLSPTSSVSPSASPTLSASPSVTLSVTLTRTITPGSSPTPTASPTSTASPSATATLSPTSTSSATPSVTPTLTATPSASPSPTPTRTITPGSSRTATVTPSTTPSDTFTVSATLSATASPSRTGTPTFGVTPSASPSPDPSMAGLTPAPSVLVTACSTAGTFGPGYCSPLGACLPAGFTSSWGALAQISNPYPMPGGTLTHLAVYLLQAGPIKAALYTGGGAAPPWTNYSELTESAAAWGQVGWNYLPVGPLTLTAGDYALGLQTQLPAMVAVAWAPLLPAGLAFDGTWTWPAFPGSFPQPAPGTRDDYRTLPVYAVYCPQVSPPTPTSTPSPSMASGSGEPRIRQCLPVPQPQGGPRFRFAVFIEGGTADSVELKVFSAGYNCVAHGSATGTFSPGWNHPVSFDLPGLANGTYFVLVQAGVGGKLEKAGRPFKLVVLR